MVEQTESTIDYIKIIEIAVVVLIGSGVLVGIFNKMTGGFGPNNLKATLLVLIIIFATLLGISSGQFEATLGILGAIAGYLFGINNTKSENSNSKKKSTNSGNTNSKKNPSDSEDS